LCKQGFEISQEELEAKASGTVGRPHMAQVLVEKGYTDSVEHAFQNFLGPKGAAFVPKAKLSAPQAMDVLKAESATVILAHPGLLQLDDNSLDRLVRELASQGLDGLEVHYPEHDAAQTAFYLELAARHGLAVSGGTDFHGQVKPGLELGTGYGDFGVPVSVLEGLKARRQSRGLPV
jgi:predicted metal-dependent phosphoesterase TrpH